MTQINHPLTYPDSPRQDLVEELHGLPIADPYRWLEDIDSEAAQSWIEAQNKLTFDYLDQIADRREIEQRLTELWNYEKFDLPFKRGGRYFLSHNDGLQNQNVLYWLDSLADEPKLLLDPNQLSEDGTVALMGLAVSPNGKWLAYGLSASGSDWQAWRIREIETGRDLEDHLQWVKFSGASWSPDSTGFLYSRYDEPAEGLAYKGPNYYHKLYYHRLGTAQSEDQLIYQRPDQKEWGIGGRLTEDGRYLIMHIWRGTDRENGVFYREWQRPESEVVELCNQFEARYEFIGHEGPIFYFYTDHQAPMAKVIAIDIQQPDRANWGEIIPEGEDALRGVSLINDRFIAAYLHDAYSQVKMFDKAGRLIQQVDLPGIGSVSGFGGRQSDSETFYQFTNFTTPGAIYHYDLTTDQTTLFRRPQVNFDPDHYTTEQVFYPSKDGTQIPMFLTYKKGLVLNGHNPTFLYGYGGFDIPITPAFAVSNLAWLERGGIYAVANLRGGGEYGQAWHQAGMQGNKQNVFDDFIAAAEWLIANDYTRTARLAIGGGSNGGLLVGACLTQRPDLFGACFAAVGVLDMLRFHQFTIGWAWTSDYGSPDEPEDFATLLAYSPYHNLKPGTAYPPTLITTGDHDDRVFPAHSFKFAAALQAAQGGSAPTLIRIDTKAGHGAGKPTGKIIAEVADRWAFLWQNLTNG